VDRLSPAQDLTVWLIYPFIQVHQKAAPQGYRLIADVSGPQMFSETVSVDKEDRRPIGIELLKLKTSALDVQRPAVPRGMVLEAEVLEPKPQTTKFYIARTKCIEASVEKPPPPLFVEKPLEDGSPPVFVVQLQVYLPNRFFVSHFKMQ